MGVYGNHPKEVADETTDPSDQFLGAVCQAWEKAAEPARSAGIRVVHPRMGVVLSGQGGALKRMLPVVLGRRRRATRTWETVDAMGCIGRCFGNVVHGTDGTIHFGPVNVVSPKPVQNADFTKVLGAVIRRPTVIPVPVICHQDAVWRNGGDIVVGRSKSLSICCFGQRVYVSTCRFRVGIAF